MKRELLSQAFGDLDERFVLEACRPAPEDAALSPERIVHMNKKRMICFMLAAALLLALGITAYAVAGSGAIGSHWMPQDGESADLAELPRIEKTVGYPLSVPEAFSDGYVFTSLRVRGEGLYSDTGELEREFYGVHALYTKSGAPDRWLDLSPNLGPAATEPTERRRIGGTEVALSLDHYKVVPENYEKTQEDLSKEAAGHYYISFGSAGIEEYDFASASFTLDGVDYCLTDTAASPAALDTLAAAAAELTDKP